MAAMYCANHPQVQATWQCTRCQRLACEDCVKRIGARRTQVGACKACDGMLKEVSAQPLLTGAEDFIDLMKRVFSVEGIIVAAAVSIFAALANWFSFVLYFPTLMRVLYWGAVSSFYFMIIDHIGRNRPGLPGPPELDSMADIIGLIFRGLVCGLVFTLPLILYIWRADEPPGLLLSLGLLLLGMLYTPAAVLTVLLTNRTIGAVWPPGWIAIISRAPGQYVQLAGMFLASTIVWVIVNFALTLSLGQVPFLGAILVPTAGTMIILAQACLVGGFLRRNAEVLGYA